MSSVSKFIRLFVANPSGAAGLLKALLRGTFTVFYHRLVKPRVRIAFPFFMYETFRVSGPGKVFIGRSCAIYPNIFEGVSIVTLDPCAEVRIGTNCSLGGVTIRCRERIEIGDGFMAGHSLIQDCMLVECPTARENEVMPQEMPSRVIRIGRNVWVGAQSCILRGTKIGDDSVVSLGTVCYGAGIAEYQLASGNPSFRPVPISKLIELQDMRR
jgi:acetyltransferase-like isoleucine patch superfamily enzyme